MVSTACSGDPGADPGSTDPGIEDTQTAALVSPFEVLRQAGHGDQGAGAPAVRRALGHGADRLAALQADTIGDNARNGLVDTDPDDGGWDFVFPSTTTSHTAAVSFPNLYGETALGLWAAVQSGGAGNRALLAAVDAGLGMQANPDIDSPPDFAFGVLLGELTENPGFAEIARAHYDAKRASQGGAAGLGAFIRDGRHARREDGLIAYDVGWLAISAAALDAAFPGNGYDVDSQTYSQIIVDDLIAATPDFDLDDPTEAFYVIGLAWSQVAAQRAGEGDLFRDVRSRLLDQQRGNGAWPTSATQSADDLQSTAIAVETLALTDRLNGRARQTLRRGVRFLLGEQAANGGWPDAAGNELPLVDAEVMLGLMLARTPEGEDGLVPAADAVARRADAPVALGPRAAPLP
jgi:hypothetical protein